MNSPSIFNTALKFKQAWTGKFTSVENEQAIKTILQHNLDIVLMDCQMPVMDGFTATRSIRRNRDIATELPIIAIAANTTGKDLEFCLELG